ADRPGRAGAPPPEAEESPGTFARGRGGDRRDRATSLSPGMRGPSPLRTNWRAQRVGPKRPPVRDPCEVAVAADGGSRSAQPTRTGSGRGIGQSWRLTATVALAF